MFSFHRLFRYPFAHTLLLESFFLVCTCLCEYASVYARIIQERICKNTYIIIRESWTESPPTQSLGKKKTSFLFSSSSFILRVRKNDRDVVGGKRGNGNLRWRERERTFYPTMFLKLSVVRNLFSRYSTLCRTWYLERWGIKLYRVCCIERVIGPVSEKK